MDIERKLQAIEKALERLGRHEADCRLCPRECGADRAAGRPGFCGAGVQARLARGLLHYGEEPVLSGTEDWPGHKPLGSALRRGSGTIFFSGCGLKCLFCQNYQLSWLGQGLPVTDEEMAGLMLDLQARGALNINFVTPGHVLLPILRSLRLAYRKGLALPLVWNSSGYERASTLAELEGIIDIYLPDLKYFSPQASQRLASAPDYFLQACRAVEEMHRQRPALILDETGMAREGLIIRHLVLPGQHQDSIQILNWVREHLPPPVCLSLMGQYHPVFKPPEDLRRPLPPEEYRLVLDKAQELGFETIFAQAEAYGAEEHLVPDFDREDPFGWDGPLGNQGGGR
jgi:putative pyruvate formate lyase activating enzyme